MVREVCNIVKGDEVHSKLLEGSWKIADAVSTTFGPYGKNVGITMLYNLPHITKDGVSVAHRINLKDPIENIAAQIIKQAAKSTANVAGDGTTSTTILAYAIVSECINYLKSNPTKTNELKTSLNLLKEEYIKKVENQSKQIQSKEDIEYIAGVSCNNDKEIINLITEAFDIVGKDGVITISDSKSYKTYVEGTTGIRLDRTHISPIFEMGRNKTICKDCNILTTDIDFRSFEDANKLVSLQNNSGKPLLVICNDITDNALNAIAYYKQNNNIPIEIVRAPGIADVRRESIKDLAIITGATALMKDEGWTIDAITEKNLGSADSFEITLKETNIIGRHGDKEKIESRINYYKEKIEADNQGLKENYIKRLSMFNSGAAVVYIGGTNEVEVQEKKDRVDDTIRAVKSALEEGYVTGGCTTYYNLIEESKEDAKKIMNNAFKMLLETLLENKEVEYTKENIDNLILEVLENNIIDPTLVIKSTIQNAIGAAIMIFTTECVIIREEIE